MSSPDIAPVPVAHISGPIPFADSLSPFTGWGVGMLATSADPPDHEEPVRRGYTMEEYVISGPIDGGEYSTSLLIRRPADPARFSGVVAFETLHGGGSAIVWPMFWDALTRRGHGYALVVSQRTALNLHVRPWHPERYNNLSIPAATIPYAGTGGFGQYVLDVMGPEMIAQSRVLFTNDTRNSYAIMSQAGALLKTTPSLFGAPVRSLVMSGFSQSGHQTVGYLMEAHGTTRLADGRFIFDGYMPQGAYWDTPFAPIGVPIALVVNEGEMIQGRPQPYRRPDSDDESDPFRLYELAACPHIATRGLETVGDRLAELSPEIIAAAGLAGVSPSAKPSQYPINMLKSALFVAFLDWVSKGTSPPSAERIATNRNHDIVRDAQGIAIGGVRSSYTDVPVVRYRGAQLMVEEPLSVETLRGLYGDEAGYVAEVQKSVAMAEADRFLLAESVPAVLADAQSICFGEAAPFDPL